LNRHYLQLCHKNIAYETLFLIALAAAALLVDVRLFVTPNSQAPGLATGSGTMADSAYAVPVYRGWPEKPYTVIGSIQFADPNALGTMGYRTCGKAGREQERGRSDHALWRRSWGGRNRRCSSDENVFSMRQVAALVIKWTPEVKSHPKRQPSSVWHPSSRQSTRSIGSGTGSFVGRRVDQKPGPAT